MEFLQLLAENFIPIIALILTGLVPVLVWVIKRKLEDWLGVQITAKQQEMIQALAYDAVDYAEEQALKYAKDMDGDKPPSSEKLKWAMDYVARQALALDLPGFTVDALRDLIESQVGARRRWKDV